MNLINTADVYSYWAQGNSGVSRSGSAAYAFCFTYIMLKVINMITPVKVEEHEEKAGVDETLHGEAAYV